MENYYKILGINHSATIQQIRNAYSMHIAHYELNSERNYFESEHYINLTAAFNTLTNEHKKIEYDRILNSVLTVQEQNQLKNNYSSSPNKESNNNTKTLNPVIKAKRDKYVRYGAVIVLVTVIIFTNAYILFKKNFFQNPNIKDNTIEVAANNTSERTIKSRSTLDKELTQQYSQSQKISIEKNKTSQVKKHHSPVRNKTKIENAVTNQPFSNAQINTENTEFVAIENNHLSEKDRILAKFGTPHSIVRFNNNTEIWHYKNDEVRFCDGQVVTN